MGVTNKNNGVPVHALLGIFQQPHTKSFLGSCATSGLKARPTSPQHFRKLKVSAVNAATL